jgi:hypothetical protein
VVLPVVVSYLFVNFSNLTGNFFHLVVKFTVFTDLFLPPDLAFPNPAIRLASPAMDLAGSAA